MSERTLYTPTEIKKLYDEILPAYQKAFAGGPWNERSQCADLQTPQRCAGGLSELAIGTECATCQSCPTLPAYPDADLAARFDQLGETRPTAWYVEQEEAGVTLAAVAWEGSPVQIATEKYSENPDMATWLATTLGNEPIVWVDEVFADREKKPGRNLDNFGPMIVSFAAKLENTTLAYRTISPAMTRVATRDFGSDAMVFERELELPDRRDFVVIRLEGN